MRANPLARTILYASTAGTGLWSVAAGFLTHHTTAAKIGAGVAALATLLFFTGAEAREPTRDQLDAAAKINLILNHRADWAELPAPCAVFALNKAWAFMAEGIDPSTIRVAIVEIPKEGLHAVAEIVTATGTTVYDSGFPHPESRRILESDLGYRWKGEFVLAGAPQ